MFTRHNQVKNESAARKELKSALSTPPLAHAEARTPATEKPEAPQAEGAGTARLVVGPDVKLKSAEILDCDALIVEGRVEATMDSRVMRIAERGAFIGKVSVDTADIRGTLEGELTARTQLTIHATGRVFGVVRYGKLVIEEGGELCGDVNALGGEKPAQRPHQRDEQSSAEKPAP